MCGQCVCVRVCDVHACVCWEKYQYTAKDINRLFGHGPYYVARHYNKGYTLTEV